MAFTNPPDDVLSRLLTDAQTIAVVGASNNAARASHGIAQQLIGAGYRVVPVNPNEAEVLGQKAYASVDDIPFDVDIIDVFLRPDAVLPVAQAAVRKRAKALWLQLGIVNEEAATLAQAAGLVVVMDACIGVAHRRLHVTDRRRAADQSKATS